MTVLTLIPFGVILWIICVDLGDIKDELRKIREAKEKEAENGGEKNHQYVRIASFTFLLTFSFLHIVGWLIRRLTPILHARILSC